MGAIIELGYRRLESGHIAIDTIATCARAGRQQSDTVATVVDPDNPNPAVALRDGIVPVGLLRKIVDYVETRPWEDADG